MISSLIILARQTVSNGVTKQLSSTSDNRQEQNLNITDGNPNVSLHVHTKVQAQRDLAQPRFLDHTPFPLHLRHKLSPMKNIFHSSWIHARP